MTVLACVFATITGAMCAAACYLHWWGEAIGLFLLTGFWLGIAERTAKR